MTSSLDTTTLPITKAARLLGVHPNTLRAWTDQGRIRCYRVNGRGDRRFQLDDLQAFLGAATSGPADGHPAPPMRAPRAIARAPAADIEAQIDSIAKLGTRLNHLSSVDEIGQAICAELRQLIDYHNVRVYRVRGEDVVPVAWQGQVSEYIDEDGTQLRVRVGEGITGWVAKFGMGQYLPNAALDPRGQLMPGTEEDLEESMLVAPMVYEDRAIGVIVLSKLGLDQFAPQDLRYLGIYAAIAAQAMINADISARLRAQQETLDQQLHGQRELLRVTEAILTNLDPAAVMAEVADSLGRIIPVDTMGVYVHQVRQRQLAPLLARGVNADAFLARRLPDTGGVATEVLTTGEARSVRRTGVDPAAIILAPLRGRERVLGILYIKRRGADARFDARELDLVRIFAAHASIALQNALTHRAVEIRAQMDALTGLRNHGTFREELQAAVQNDDTFALLMLDLDEFKSYNDQHGHQAGNRLLQAVAEGIRSASRESDHVYRYGGDEFSLILPRTRRRDAVEVAERVRLAIRQAPGTDALPAQMRCSVGLAIFPADGDDQASLLLAADRALYAAKRAGRDRVATAEEGLALAGEFVPPSMPVENDIPVLATPFG